MVNFSWLQRVVLVASALLLLGAPGHATGVCDAPPEITADIEAMPNVAAVLKPGGTLNVLTVGSATVFNPSESLQPGTIMGQALALGTSPRPGAPLAPQPVPMPAPSPQPVPSAAAFPLQMAKAIETMVPGVAVKVEVRGGRGMTAAEMLDILRREVAAAHYDLIVWQTGTVEAVRNVPTGVFYQTLADGATVAAASHAELVLVDPQFSRFLHANADVDAYLQPLQEVAALPGVTLFHRFELMHHWSTTGQIDLERTPRGQRLRMVEQLHACLGQALAKFVIDSAHTAP